MLCLVLLGYKFFEMICVCKRKSLTYIYIEILDTFSWGFLIQIENSTNREKLWAKLFVWWNVIVFFRAVQKFLLAVHHLMSISGSALKPSDNCDIDPNEL